MKQFLEFRIDDYRFAFETGNILKVERSAMTEPLPGCPEPVYGILDFHGRQVPVISLREKFSLKAAELTSEMFFILINTGFRLIAVIAGSLGQIFTCEPGNLLKGEDVDASYFPESILRTDDGIILICDPEKLLSSQEKIDIERLLDPAEHEL